MPNLDEAQRFLALLDESVSLHTFQTFDDKRDRKNPDLIRLEHGDLEAKFSALTELNNRGAGVYISVQEMDGTGRKIDCLKRIRAIFQEDDGEGKDLPLEPHIVVNTSPGKYHRYILVDDLNQDEFAAVMEVIVSQYGGDRNAMDVARVLRLPGFSNHKYGSPYPVSIFHESGSPPYTKDEVFKAFNVTKIEQKDDFSANYDGSELYVSETTVRDLREALTHLDANDTKTWFDVGLALKTIGNIGRDLWIEWSKRSDKWVDEHIKHWHTFKPEKITYKSIFYSAQEAGWENPMAGNAQMEDPEEDLFKDLQAIFCSELPKECEFPDELVEGLLVRNEISILYGDSNSGKTFFGIDIACAVALGLIWMNRRTEQGLVLYIASESPSSVRFRIKAYEKYHNVSIGDNLLIVQAPINFYQSDTDVKRLARLLQKVCQTTGKRIELIIGDTLARMSAGANESAGEDMGKVMARFDAIKNYVEAHVLIIAHSGKDATRGLRGWSGMRAHVDTEIEVKEKDGVRVATVTKQRGLPGKGDEIVYDLHVVEMGKTKWNAPATTCVVVPATKSEKSQYSWETMILIDAWSRDGYEMVNQYPYVSRKAVRLSVEAENAKLSKRTVDNRMGKFKKMCADGLLDAYSLGWLVSDGMISSQLIVFKGNHTH